MPKGWSESSDHGERRHEMLSMPDGEGVYSLVSTSQGNERFDRFGESDRKRP